MNNSHDSITTDENIDIVLDLLDEYSAKLRSMVQIQQDKYQKRVGSRIIILSVLIIFVGSTALMFNISSLMQNYWLLGGLSFITITLFTLFYYGDNSRRYLELLEEDIKISTDQLRQVTNIVSQIEYHTNQTLGTELKIQLRLAESEGAIRLARDAVYIYTRKHPNRIWQYLFGTAIG